MARNTDRKGNDKSNSADFDVFVVTDKGNGKTKWTKIGSAYAHEDGNGYQVSELNVVPVPGGRIVLRVPLEKDSSQEA